MEIIQSPCDVRTMTARCLYDYLKICQIADYYKVVEATAIRRSHENFRSNENAKIGIVRSS